MLGIHQFGALGPQLCTLLLGGTKKCLPFCVCVDCKQPPTSTPCPLRGGSVFHFLQPSLSQDWGAAKGTDKAQLGVRSLVCNTRPILRLRIAPWCLCGSRQLIFFPYEVLALEVLDFWGEKAVWGPASHMLGNWGVLLAQKWIIHQTHHYL